MFKVVISFIPILSHDIGRVYCFHFVVRKLKLNGLARVTAGWWQSWH